MTKLPDVERTRRLGELLRQRYGQDRTSRDRTDVAARWLVLDEVPNAAGFAYSRTADYVAVGLWPSDGLQLIGHEVKVSRGDLKRELADPLKATGSGHYCDEWWLVLWDAKIMAGLAVPESWGIMVRQGEETEEGSLKVLKKAATLQEAGAISRSNMAVLLRRAARLSAGAWQLGEAVRLAAQHSYREGKRQGAGNLEHDLMEKLAPLKPGWRAANGSHRSWEQPTIEELCEYAASLVTQPAPTP